MLASTPAFSLISAVALRCAVPQGNHQRPNPPLSLLCVSQRCSRQMAGRGKLGLWGSLLAALRLLGWLMTGDSVGLLQRVSRG